MRKLCLALIGIGALISGPAVAQADDAFMAQIITITSGFCPANWAEMDGRLLSIGQNQPLFGLLGTRYGGSGSQFALPTAQPIFGGDGLMLRQCIALQGVFPSNQPPQ